MPRDATSDHSVLQGPDGSRVVFLLDASTEYESRLLDKWLQRHHSEPETRRIKASRRRRAEGDDLADTVEPDSHTFFIPVRVVWMAPEKRGRRSVGWSDAFKPGDPRDPRGLRARYIRTFHPGRVKLIAAPGATVSDLARDYVASGEIDGLDGFITRRAWRSLDKVERNLRGNRYKIPRFVPEAILSRGEFATAVDEYAIAAAIDPADARTTAARYLREIAATHSPYVIDLIANAIHTLYRQGYGDIKYSTEEVGRIAALGAEHPLVFLPSHRSNLDRLSLQFMLWENDLPPNHTAGGINLDFFPIGPLLRRTGVFFIRRSFRDNELYKIVLRSYLDYLIEKRFPLEWYMEGGRSRSGKLSPPRFGLLSYVVDAQRRGKSDDIKLIPVSIAYDQIQDVPDYAREAQGKGKERESLGWLFKAVRSLRRRYGDIYIRFGEPVSVSEVTAAIGDDLEDSPALHKLAFEVMYRIGRVTPTTPTAVVSIALLAARGKARSAAEIAGECSKLLDFIRARDLPTTESLDLADGSTVTTILDWLAEHGNVSSHEALERRVWWLDDEQMIRTSYYRNVVVHFFVNRAIAEVALLSWPTPVTATWRVSPRGCWHSVTSSSSSSSSRTRTSSWRAWAPTSRLTCPGGRRSSPVPDRTTSSPSWVTPSPIGLCSPSSTPIRSSVTNWRLREHDFDEKRFLQACLDRARMYRIEERLFSGESASTVLFRSALALAENRGLLEADPDVGVKRSEFAAEVRAARSLAATGMS